MTPLIKGLLIGAVAGIILGFLGSYSYMGFAPQASTVSRSKATPTPSCIPDLGAGPSTWELCFESPSPTPKVTAIPWPYASYCDGLRSAVAALEAQIRSIEASGGDASSLRQQLSALYQYLQKAECQTHGH